jgi:hypothetical protein
MMNRLVHKILRSTDRYRHIELGADLPVYGESQPQGLFD